MPIRNTDPYDRDFTNSINTRPASSDEIAYRDGYVRGKSAEQIEQDRRRAANARRYESDARMRADNGVSTGLLLGLVLAAAAAVVGGALFLISADQGTVTPTPEATTPQPVNPQPANDTTIIQRTIERTREVVPAPTNGQTPPANVETTPQPVPETVAPAPAPVAPAPEAAPMAPAPEAAPEATTTPGGTP